MLRKIIFYIFLFSIVPFYPILNKFRRYKSKIDGIYFFLFQKILPKDRIDCIRLGQSFGSFLHFLRLSDRNIEKNMTIVYGESHSLKFKKQLKKEIYRFLGSAFFELISFAELPNEEIQSMMFVENPEMIEQIKTLQKKNGIVFLSAHAGNIEFCMQAFSMLFPKLVGYTTIQAPIIEQHLEKIRKKTGGDLVKKSKWSSIKLIKYLKNNYIISLAADMDFNKATIFRPFFGEMVSVVNGVYYFANKIKAPVYFVCAMRDPDFRYRCIIKEIPVDYSVGTPDDWRDTIVSLYLKELEQLVQDYPEQQYFWLSKRWKTRPPGENNKNFYS